MAENNEKRQDHQADIKPVFLSGIIGNFLVCVQNQRENEQCEEERYETVMEVGKKKGQPEDGNQDTPLVCAQERFSEDIE